MKWSRYHSTSGGKPSHRLTASLLRISVESVCVAFLLACGTIAGASTPPAKGVASWYGEDHRGRLMANGKQFDPDKFTAASWFYPLGTKVRVTARSTSSTHPARSVLVTITDRGPATELVRGGRLIDLSAAPFKRLASPESGLVAVSVQRVKSMHRARS